MTAGNEIVGAIRPLLIAILIILAMPVAWLFWGYNYTFRPCIHLKNGLNIGYEAVFDLSRPYFRPIAVPRFADGTPLIRDETWAVYVTDTTLYGETFIPFGGLGYRFAWRSDSGLVRRRDDPDLYDRLIGEAGPANIGLPRGSLGAGSILWELSGRSGFRKTWCPTALITW